MKTTNLIDVFKYYDLAFDVSTGKTTISKEDLVNLCGRYARIMCSEQKHIMTIRILYPKPR